MSQEYFDFSKFVDDLDDKANKQKEMLQRQAEFEKNNRTRDLNKLYREHPLAKTYVGLKND